MKGIIAPFSTALMLLLFAGTSLGQGASQTGAPAQQQGGADAAKLAKKLANPVASMISVPFQSNFDFGMGPNEDGFRYTLNIQPVIPFKLGDNWDLMASIGPYQSMSRCPSLSGSDISRSVLAEPCAAGRPVRTPNSDTPYSYLGADLRAEPLVFTVPAVEKDRSYSVQFGERATIKR